ncbi:MAG: 2-phospho-L-lactate transferase [Candidatus Hodarchaeales archaeon]
MSLGNIVILTGGTGTVKLIEGLYNHLPDKLVIVCNTGDDWDFYGLYVSPDTDAVLYTLSNQLDRSKMWGIKDDTFVVKDVIQSLDDAAEPVASWFNLGDVDLAHCLYRNYLLNQGLSLTKATDIIRRRLGIKSMIFPMSDERVTTNFQTPEESYHIQEFFIKLHGSKKIENISFNGASNAKLIPELKNEISNSSLIIIGPSNPISSISPILAISEIKRALQDCSAKKVVISPIIGNKAFSGPAADYMTAKGLAVSPEGIFQFYQDIGDIFLFHEVDKSKFDYLKKEATILDKEIFFHNILFQDLDSKKKFAKWLLREFYQAKF